MFRLVVCIDVMLIKLTLSGIWGVYRLGGKKQLGKVQALMQIIHQQQRCVSFISIIEN